MFQNITLLEKLYDRYATAQLRSFFTWVKAHHTTNTHIYVHLPSLTQHVNENREAITVATAPDFLICKSGQLHTALEHENYPGDEVATWHPLFTTPYIEIWESQKDTEPQTTPLHLGTTPDEQHILLGIARTTLTHILQGKELSHIDTSTQSRLDQKMCVDVTLWTSGTLRGSRIIENSPARAAVQAAAHAALYDERFKPLSLNELTDTRIQISLWTDLYIPLSYEEWVANEIYASKGYQCAASGQHGRYLSSVHNRLVFQNLKHLAAQLMHEKTSVHIPYAKAHRHFSLFATDDFIDDAQGHSLKLHGPVVQCDTSKLAPHELFTTIGESAADFLLRIQENDGNFPTPITVFTGEKGQIDWIRASIACWSLALYGDVTQNTCITQAATRSLIYLKDSLAHRGYAHPEIRRSALIYLERAEQTLSPQYDRKVYIDHIYKIETDDISKNPGPIFVAQYALFLLDHTNEIEGAKSMAKGLTEKLAHELTQNQLEKKSVGLALYPELITLFTRLGDHERANTLLMWYLSQKLPDGSFPGNTTSSYGYVRGTGKIFEVLALHDEYTESRYHDTLAWFYTMQYTPSNTFFVQENIRKEMYGGFRHDYVNSSVWIDANAHVLIGIARILGRT